MSSRALPFLLVVALTSLTASAGNKPGKPVRPDRGCGKLSLVQVWRGDFSLSLNQTDQLGSSHGVTFEAKRAWSLSGKLELKPAFDEGDRRENDWRGEEQNFGGKVRQESATLTGRPETDYRVIAEGTALATTRTMPA